MQRPLQLGQSYGQGMFTVYAVLGRPTYLSADLCFFHRFFLLLLLLLSSFAA